MDQNLRDLLDSVVGEPPRAVTTEAVRRRAIRRRAAQATTLSLAVACAAALVGAVLTGAISAATPPPTGPREHVGPPRYYIAQVWDQAAHRSALVVRSTATGRVTATIRDPRPNEQCGDQLAAAAGQTFFMTCIQTRPASTGQTAAGGPAKHRHPSIGRTDIVRFQLTGSGRVAGYSLVKGGAFRGELVSGIAAAPDGSHLAVDVLRPTPSGAIYTNTVPAGVMVISTLTGVRTFWHSGPYVPGAVQFAGAISMSFTRDARTLVVLEARCPRGRYQSDCTGHADAQVRAYNLTSAGGSLEKGRVLLSESALEPAGTSMNGAFIDGDGSAITTVLTTCPRHGACTLSVARISVPGGKVQRVLYLTHTGSRFEGVFERFFSADPSGRYLILDAGAGKARVNGWIDHGRLVPLVPADGNAPTYETW